MAVIIVIAAMPQLGLFLWWGSGLSTRVSHLEKEHDKLSDQVDGMTKLEIRIAMVEVILANQTRVLEQIRDRLPISNIITS
jgi:hypothetical protein